MIRVASYCRVSTDKDDQANSFESQQRYFREYIERHPDWELYEVYADEGITGTSTKKRTQFNRMINDAYEGKFSLIITKEVSRFSRNILDTISYTRELKAIGVAVQFVIDGINTMNPDAEMYLSIMASLAQEESRKTSSRVVWGQTRQMERGVVFGRSLLGYDVKEGKISVNPEGAELVRLIFHKYAIEQVSTTQIARFLTQEGYCTYRGSTSWKSNTLIKILNNEKYVGDLVQRKSYTPDFLTHEKRRNAGQVPLITICDHHEPIISREVWNLTQERLRKNNKHKNGITGHSNRYVFSGKIRCGVCGASFAARYKTLKDGSKSRRWCCGTAGCDIGKLVRDDDAMHMLKAAIRNLSIDSKSIISNVTALAVGAILAGEEGTADHAEHLTHEIERIRRKKEILLDNYLDGSITKEDTRTMNQKYCRQLEALNERLARLQHRENSQQNPRQLRTKIQEEVSALLNCEIESEVLCKTLLDQLTVFKDRHMELRLKHLPLVFQFIG